MPAERVRNDETAYEPQHDSRLSLKPLLVDGMEAVASGRMKYLGNGMLYEGTFVPDDHIYSFAALGVTGLMEELSESPFQSLFFAEMEKLNQAMIENGGMTAPATYGKWAYFARTGDLVQYPPEELHILSLVLRNSLLHTNPEMTMQWETMRERFERVVPAIMGLSVGGAIAMAIEQLMRPKHMVLADMGSWSLPNANRVSFLHHRMILESLSQVKSSGNLLGKNKADEVASLMYSMNPFRNKYVFPEGLNEHNFNELLGTSFIPKVTVLIDEADKLSDKVAVASFCRDNGIRYVGVTDAWPHIIFNIRPFDIDKTLPLTRDMTDRELYSSLHDGSRSQAGFFTFAEKYVGPHLMVDYPFGAVVRGKLPWFGMGIPQPVTAILYGAALLADRVALSATGHMTPERIILNALDLSITTQGLSVPPMQI